MSTKSVKTLKAKDVAPEAYKAVADKEDDLTYDLGNITAFDTHPIDIEKYQSSPEEYLAETARDNTQLLINRIFALPTQKSDAGPVATLPECITTIPREKPLPQPKPETRWEKFAKEKGILNKKRDRMVFDDSTEEWKPRWGYKRAGEQEDSWPIQEIKEGSTDPHAERREEKRTRLNKNLLNQAKNKLRASGKPAVPSGIPVEMNHTSGTKEKQRGKEGGRKALEMAQFSTASMGKFDQMRKGEPVRKVKGQRRQFKSSTGDLKSETSNAMSVLNSLLKAQERKKTGAAPAGGEGGGGGGKKGKGKKGKR